MRTKIRLRAGAEVSTTSTGTRLFSRTGAQSLGVLTDAQHHALDALRVDRDEQELLTPATFAQVCGLLARLRRGNWLAATLSDDGPPLTVHPACRTAPNLTSVIATVRAAHDIVLSRFSLVRPENGHFVVESPRSGFTVHLSDPAVLRMTDPRVAGLFVELGLAVPAEDPEHSPWSPHELWFHARSRRGRHEQPWGPTLRFDPPPARSGGVRGIPLPVTTSPWPMSLTETVESRRSIREHDDTRPLTEAQLGEFLFRTARTRGSTTLSGVELLDRPYPSAGALHELEIYPVVHRVSGIPRGLYHYNSHRHELVARDAEPGQLDRLLADTGTATPQVLFVITARFERVMWKYESMAYALTLKNTGALMSVMYLVATAMGLAPCALGGGDSDLFSAAAGLSYENESSVGEFLLGSRREEQS